MTQYQINFKLELNFPNLQRGTHHYEVRNHQNKYNFLLHLKTIQQATKLNPKTQNPVPYCASGLRSQAPTDPYRQMTKYPHNTRAQPTKKQWRGSHR